MHTHTKYRLVAGILLSILLLNTLILQSPIIGGLGMCIYILCIIHILYHTFQSRTLAFLVIIASLISINTGVYYVYNINVVTSYSILFASYGVFFLPSAKKPIGINRMYKYVSNMLTPFRQWRMVMLACSVASIDSILLGTMWVRRTTDVLISPWSAVGSWFFILFFIGTMLLIFFIIRFRHTGISLILLSLHAGTMFGIAPLLYPLGYGFDAFVHRATESWIFEHGFILPKQPYYIGQYSVVVFLAQITHLPLFWIDVLLVPVLAAILLPHIISQSIRRAWKVTHPWHLLLVLPIFSIPFLNFNLTTPHNVVMLLSLCTIFTTLAYYKDKKYLIVPLLTAIAACATHPLIGAPVTVFLFFALLTTHASSKKGKALWIGLGSLANIILLPMLFTLNNLRMGLGFPHVDNPFLELPKFFSLFSLPYWYRDSAPLFWELVYTWERMLIPILVLLSMLGFVLLKRTKKHIWLFFLTSMALAVSAWLLRSWIIFPDVIVYEQGDYPMRMLRASFFFLTPCLLYACYILGKTIQKKNLQVVSILFFSCILTVSLYFSYPQQNPKVQFPGYNVTQADFDTVRWIENDSAAKPYIVLANQLTSAAALTTYGFDRTYDIPDGEVYFYAIPTGGVLYHQYGNMLYNGQKREYMETAMNIANVDTAYFVLSKFWANANTIITGALQTADRSLSIDSGNMWIFVYER